MKKKYFSSLLLLSILVNGCATNTLQKDTDNDGVIDIYDKCQNTPFIYLVDATGCRLKK